MSQANSCGFKIADPDKFIHLESELNLAYELIKLGFANLQKIGFNNDFYHLPQLLLASRIERFMKCYICLSFKEKNDNFSNVRNLKNLGHNLSKLKQKICDKYYNKFSNSIEKTVFYQIEKDFSFIMENKILGNILYILSEFGTCSRYYNCDIVTGRKKPSIDANDEWEELERSIENTTPYLDKNNPKFPLQNFYTVVNRKIIATLEQFLRAIAMQFSIGGDILRPYTNIFDLFKQLKDKEFGKTDYRS